METETRTFELERWSIGVGNNNSWTVYDHASAKEVAVGHLWHSKKQWYAERSNESSRSMLAFDTPSEAMTFLLRRNVTPEMLIGTDIVLT